MSAWRWIALLALTVFSSAPVCAAEKIIYRTDFPNVPKLVFDAKVDDSTASADRKVQNYVLEHLAAYDIETAPSDLKLMKKKVSLLGTHYYYQQSAKGYRVKRAELIVSLANDGKTIYRVFNNLHPRAINSVEEELISPEKAIAIVWEDLRVHGALKAEPGADLYYFVHKKTPILAYEVALEVEKPYGAWVYYVNAIDGQIVEARDTRIYRKNRAPAHPHSYKGPVWSYEQTLAAFRAQPQSKVTKAAAVRRADGKGLAFNPDPRTHLQDDTLADTSPAEAFEAAYVEVPLRELTVEDNVYKMDGPWVQIIDFDAPTTAPSTSEGGEWTQKRGDNAFNDVMTYFHIDQSQRYMQSLGFKDDKGIQFASIPVDTDGVNGQDNSYYQPGTNQLAFGHGCVDDNEDTDVILHEYGHAIQHSISDNWTGGDTGAMGEGFGDYWAGSYSISTANGRTFNVNQVFTWDGHGAASECWDGRILNATGAQYDPGRTYGAHSRIDGGFESDELWSTPLFQTLLAATEAGIAREEIDRIVLESHFGIGVGLSMREMATITIQTAGRMYEAGRHAELFTDNFVVNNIVEVARPILSVGAAGVTEAGENGAADPGETVKITVPLKNSGQLAATGISARLIAKTSGVDVVQGNSPYPDLTPGSEAVNATAFEVAIANDVACGEKLTFDVEFTYGDSKTMLAQMTLGTGFPVTIEKSATPDLAIPDGGVAVTDILSLTDGGQVSTEFQVALDIQHTYIGDLEVSLQSPAGTVVRLHDRTGQSQDNLTGRYPATLSPAESMDGLVGEELAGDWRLSVRDSAAADTGKFVSWGLSNISHYECDAP